MDYISVKEYARLNKLSASAIYSRIRRGRIPDARKVGRIWFIPKTYKMFDERMTTGEYIGWRDKFKNNN